MRNGESMVPSGPVGGLEREIAHTRARMDSILSSLEATLTPGMIIDRAFGYLKDQDIAKRAGKAAGKTAWNQIKENPVAFAIMGAGVAYWIFGGKDKEEKGSSRGERYTSHPYEAGETYVGRPAGEVIGTSSPYEEGPGIRERAGEKADVVRSRAKETAEEARHKAQDAKARVSGMTARASESVRGVASNVKARASGAAQSAKSRANDVGRSMKGAYSKAATSGRSAARRAQHTASRAGSEVASQAREHPFLFAGLAMMVTAVIGLLLPSTRREDRLLGPRRERLFRRADEMGARGVEKVRDVANQAFEAAHEKVSSTDESEVSEAIEAEMAESPGGEEELEATGTVPPESTFETGEERSSGDELGRQ